MSGLSMGRLGTHCDHAEGRARPLQRIPTASTLCCPNGILRVLSVLSLPAFIYSYLSSSAANPSRRRVFVMSFYWVRVCVCVYIWPYSQLLKGSIGGGYRWSGHLMEEHTHTHMHTHTHWHLHTQDHTHTCPLKMQGLTTALSMGANHYRSYSDKPPEKGKYIYFPDLFLLAVFLSEIEPWKRETLSLQKTPQLITAHSRCG